MSAWTIAFIVSLLLIILTVRKKHLRTRLKVVFIVFEIALALFLAFKVLFPMFPVPEPTGSNQVRVDTIYYRHKTKYPEMATNGDEREIPVHVYYPEKMERKSHPLLVFSHGSFGIGSSNETLFYELASRGYIVMSPDHPHHAFFSTLSSGKNVFVDRTFFREVMNAQGSDDLEGTLASLNRWVDPRIEDIDFVLDKILDEKEDNIYEDKIDPERMVLSGHSLGGSAVLAIGRERPRDIRGLVVLEAPFVKDIIGIQNGEYQFVEGDYPRPILHIYSDALWGKMDGITTYDRNAQLIRLNDPRFVNRHISGVGHIGLTDMALVSPIITNAVDGGLNKRKAPETLLELNREVLDFLESPAMQ